jgi:hypothetical protein
MVIAEGVAYEIRYTYINERVSFELTSLNGL